MAALLSSLPSGVYPHQFHPAGHWYGGEKSAKCLRLLLQRVVGCVILEEVTHLGRFGGEVAFSTCPLGNSPNALARCCCLVDAGNSVGSLDFSYELFLSLVVFFASLRASLVLMALQWPQRSRSFRIATVMSLFHHGFA